MALLIDGSAPSIQDIQSYESNVLEVANTEGINLAEKMKAALDEVSAEVAFCLGEPAWIEGVSGSAMERVVLTPPLRRWLTFRCLAILYREAHFNQLNQRYSVKWNEYQKQDKHSREEVLQLGIGLAGQGVRKAAKPVASITTGTASAGSYFFRIAWVGRSGAEGELSEPVAVTLAAAGGIAINPSGTVDGTLGWNVYAGRVESELALQNSAPIAMPGVWEIPAGGLVEGKKPGIGQLPDSYVRLQNILWRG